jgi:phage gp29-like protein
MIKEFIQKFTKKDKQKLTDNISTVSIYDRYSTYPSKGLTPEKLASLLREADTGDIYRQMELFEEMLEKDAHLQALFQARRLAVTRRNYNIIPVSEDPKDAEIADDVDKMIKRIKGWKNKVADFLDSVPKCFSVSQLLWTYKGDKLVIGSIKYLHQKKFRFGKVTDQYSDPEELRMLIDPNQIASYQGLIPPDELTRVSTDGVSIDNNPALRQRFIITYCKARSGNPARTSLLRTCTYLFLFKNYDIKWWVSFAEVLLGYRVGKYDPLGVDADGQKRLLEEALAGLATDSAAIISKDSVIEFIEMAQKATSHSTYKDLKDWCNSEMSEVVLGHTGTTTGTPGKLGQDDTAKEVKEELIEADAQVVDEAITDDIIKPYIDLNYGPQEEYPYYQTNLSKSLNLSEEASVDIKLQEMGYPLTKKYVKEKYGRPLPNPNDKEDEVLTPRPAQSPFPGPGTVAAKDDLDSKKKLLMNR